MGWGRRSGEAGWDGGSSGRAIGKHGSSKEGEFGQALTGFGGVNELAGKPASSTSASVGAHCATAARTPEAGVRAGAGVRCVRAHESQRQCPAVGYPPGPRERSDRQEWRAVPCPPRAWSCVVGQFCNRGRQKAVMSTATGWSPPCVCGCHCPSASTCLCHRASRGLIAQFPCPNAAHARRTARSDRPHALRPGITAPRVVSTCPLTSIHSRCSMPRFVPTGKGATKAQINVTMRYTACGTRSLLRLSTVSASALYQRLSPAATPLPETRVIAGIVCGSDAEQGTGVAR